MRRHCGERATARLSLVGATALPRRPARHPGDVAALVHGLSVRRFARDSSRSHRASSDGMMHKISCKLDCIDPDRTRSRFVRAMMQPPVRQNSRGVSPLFSIAIEPHVTGE
jgi:hypothetical protein